MKRGDQMMMNEEIVVAGLPLQFPKPTAGSQLPTLAEWNQRYIEYVLSFTKGKKTAAARILGINRRTLYRRKKVKSSHEDVVILGMTNVDRVGAMEAALTGVPPGHQVQ
jgi:DNA-binding NtrC family response regulator